MDGGGGGLAGWLVFLLLLFFAAILRWSQSEEEEEEEKVNEEGRKEAFDVISPSPRGEGGGGRVATEGLSSGRSRGVDISC